MPSISMCSKAWRVVSSGFDSNEAPAIVETLYFPASSRIMSLILARFRQSYLKLAPKWAKELSLAWSGICV